jgi:hypothetical protein
MTTNELTISNNINVDQEHLINVAISQIEERLHSRHDTLIKAIKDTEHCVKDLQNNIKDKCNAIAVTNYEPSFKKICEGLKSLKIQLNTQYEGDLLQEYDDKKFIFIKASIYSDKNHNAMVSIETSDKIYKIPESINSDIKKIANYEKDLTSYAEEAVEIKRRLNNMGRMERRAKGRLAEITLSKSTTGVKLLAEIRNSMTEGDSFLKALPL